MPSAHPRGAEIPAPLGPLVSAPKRAALFLDFDGTLSAVVADPRAARPLPVSPLLGDLAAVFALVAVVSGRPTAFLSDVLGGACGSGVGRALRARARPARPEHDAWATVIESVVTEARDEAPHGRLRRAQGAHSDPALAPGTRAAGLGPGLRRAPTGGRGLAVHHGRAERELRPPVQVDKGTVVRSLVAEHDGQPGTDALAAAAAFGDDMGDLPTFAALGELRTPDGRRLHTVRIAAVDAESPVEVAGAADVTVEGAAGAVELLRSLLGRGPTGHRVGRRSLSRCCRHLVLPPVRRRTPTTAVRSAAARSARSAGGMVSAMWSASAVATTSKGFTPRAPCPSRSSSSQAPAWRESTRTPSAVLRSGPSLATRLSPSRTGLTSRTSQMARAASERARSSSTDNTMGTHPSAGEPCMWLIRSAVCTTSAP